MKRAFFLAAVSVLLTYSAVAQQFKLLSGEGDAVVISHKLKSEPFQYSTIDQKQFIDFSKTAKVLSMEKGAPALPLFHTSVQLPATGSSLLIIESDEVTEIQNVEVTPSKGNLKRNTDPAAIASTFGDVYKENKFYPEQVAVLNDPFVWRTVRGQTITLSPYQYNPVTKVLRVHKNLRIRVEFQPAVPGLNELPVSSIDKVGKPMQEGFFINSSTDKYTPLEEEGEMLIVIDETFAEEIQPLADWKNQKGIKTTVVSKGATGTTDVEIKSYIQQFYTQHPDLIYILLVGDFDVVATHTYGKTSAGNEELWSDSYYGQLAGGETDFYPEAFVGRFSGSEAEVTTMVKRTLEYEKTPKTGNWMEKAIGLGSNEGAGIGDDGEEDWQHLRNIRTQLLNYGYTEVYEFYDGSHDGADEAGSPLTTTIVAAINEGVGLFNYTGHGDRNHFISGNVSSAKIDAITNTGMYPFVISVACNNGIFTVGTCLCESWMRAEEQGSPTGAIGTAGSSILMAWAQPMQTQDEMTEIITEAYPANKKTTLGGLFYNGQMSMLEQYPDIDGVEVMQTWVFFGDPSTQFRNKQTKDLTVFHTLGIPLATDSLVVNCDIEGTLVAVSQNNVLLGKAVVSGGSAKINFPEITSGNPLTVTATKQNYATYQGSVKVDNSGLTQDIIIYPNPATDHLSIFKSDNSVISAEVFSMTGDFIGKYTPDANGLFKIDLSQVDSGNYLVRIITIDSSTMKHFEVIR